MPTVTRANNQRLAVTAVGSGGAFLQKLHAPDTELPLATPVMLHRYYARGRCCCQACFLFKALAQQVELEGANRQQVHQAMVAPLQLINYIAFFCIASGDGMPVQIGHMLLSKVLWHEPRPRADRTSPESAQPMQAACQPQQLAEQFCSTS